MTRYRAELPAKIAEAVRQAKSRFVPAKVFVARGREESIAFNRRYHMKDGTVGWNPGKRNPQHPQARRARSTPTCRSCSSSRSTASRWRPMSTTPFISTTSAAR